MLVLVDDLDDRFNSVLFDDGAAVSSRKGGNISDNPETFELQLQHLGVVHVGDEGRNCSRVYQSLDCLFFSSGVRYDVSQGDCCPQLKREILASKFLRQGFQTVFSQILLKYSK